MGGNGTACLFTDNGCGTMFELKPPATSFGTRHDSILHSFKGIPDGAGPGSGVVRENGSFYGTTEFGGTSGLCPAVIGCGTIYKITPLGSSATERVIHSFYTKRTSTDGVWVSDTLIAGGDGNLYGATSFGGGAPACQVEPEVNGCGTFYSLTVGRGEKPRVKTLYSFAGGRDGEEPAALVGAASSGVYGHTGYGGLSAACFDGCGTIFHMTHSGSTWNETRLHVFAGPDGEHPIGSLVLDGSTLYGTAGSGGTAACFCGTLFELHT
jgi:hypothetical protein